MGKTEAEWGEAWAMVDEDGIGEIPVSKFGNAIRIAGGFPTEEDLKTMVGKADPSGSGKVGKAAFMEQMKWINRKEPDVGQVCEHFKAFDRDGEGKISAIELRHVLTSMGDKLSEEDAEDFIKEATQDKDGRIDYRQFMMEILESN
jgi:calmodulin